MKRIARFMRSERLYLLLALFVLTVNIIFFVPGQRHHRETASQPTVSAAGGASTLSTEDALSIRREEMERILHEKRPLALIISLVSLLILALVGLGVVIDVILVSTRLSGQRLDIATYRPAAVPWTLTDIMRVIVLFLFFGYMLVLIESALMHLVPVIANDNFRMMVNSSLLDILSIVFICYFTLGQYNQKLAALGLTLKNLKKNILYGIVGYIATLPILIGTLIVIAVIINLIHYVPEKQAVVELFLKETNVPLVAYTSLFAAIVGPFIEELFFRGFMYSAVKKYIGVFWATVVTAVIFGALHAHLVGFVPIMILGVLLAYLYEKTGSLVSSITVHMLHNLSMVFFVFLVKQLQG